MYWWEFARTVKNVPLPFSLGKGMQHSAHTVLKMLVPKLRLGKLLEALCQFQPVNPGKNKPIHAEFPLLFWIITCLPSRQKEKAYTELILMFLNNHCVIIQKYKINSVWTEPVILTPIDGTVMIPKDWKTKHFTERPNIGLCLFLDLSLHHNT